jgi:hypothetical protein
MNAELILKWVEPAFQRSNHTRGDTRGMPIHAHDSPEGLKPEGVGKPAEKFVASVMMNDGFRDDAS